MKIRKAIKIAVTGSVFALPAIVAAQGVGDFTTAPGNIISANALDGMTCSATTGTEEGFLQRTCNDSDGTNFIQTIVFESSSEEGEFSDSSVVMTGGSGQNGVADVNSIVDGTDFSSLQQIQTDTMLTKDLLGTGNAIDFAQTVGDSTITDETFTNFFNYVEDANENGSIILQQHLLNNSTSIPDENIAQNFDHYEVFAASDGASNSPTSVSFSAGDYLATTLINSDAGGSFFSLQDFANENTSTETGVDSLAVTAPHYDITYTGGTPVFSYQTF